MMNLQNMNNFRKYIPIRIFSIRFGYGWWWGSYFFFLGKHSTTFAIMPMSFHYNSCTFKNGLAIKDGDIDSWSPQVQRDKIQDEERK